MWCKWLFVLSSLFLAPLAASSSDSAQWASPNGKYIVFGSNRLNPENPDLYRLFVYSLQDHTTRVVTPPVVSVHDAKWSEDETKLIFEVCLSDGAQRSAQIDLEGSDSMELLSKGTLKKKLKDKLRNEKKKQLRRLRR